MIITFRVFGSSKAMLFLVENDLKLRFNEWKKKYPDSKQHLRNLVMNTSLDYEQIFVKCDIQTVMKTGIQNKIKKIGIIHSIVNEVFLKTPTCESFGILLSEIQTNEIIVNSKIDFYRFREEIQFSAEKIKEIFENTPTRILNVSVIFKIKNKDTWRKNINGLMFKTINKVGLFQKSVTFSIQNPFEHTFKVVLNSNSILFFLEFKNKLFQGLIPNNKITRHQTPVAPQMAHLMINATLENLKHITENSDVNYDEVLVIDPFTGYSTIPISFFAYSDLYYSKLYDVCNVSLNICKIFGFDADKKAIEKSNENFKKVLTEIQRKPGFHIKGLNIPKIRFYKCDIQNLLTEISSLVKNPALVLIITQPPFGFSIYKSLEELDVIYRYCFQLADVISKDGNLVVLTILTGRKALMNQILADYTKKEEKIHLKTDKIYQIQKGSEKVNYYLYLMSLIQLGDKK